MVRSPRCAHAGAQPGSAAGSPGSAALAAARLAQRRGEKATGGGAGGGGRQPQVPGKNSSKGRAALSAVPAPHTPWKFSGNYFQPPPALSCPSRRTKPFLLGVRGLASRKREESPQASVRGLELGPLGTTEMVGVTTGQRAAWGCWASGLGDTSTSERMACPPMIPVFIFDLFFIL